METLGLKHEGPKTKVLAIAMSCTREAADKRKEHTKQLAHQLKHLPQRVPPSAEREVQYHLKKHKLDSPM